MLTKNENQLIIGLGNPGKEYEKNRHNAGFLIVDILQKKLGFEKFQFNKKFNCDLSEKSQSSFLQKIGITKSKKIILVKPQTFMNNSGEAVQKIMNFYKISSKNIIVIHDDLDIIIGKYKTTSTSSAAGHNGVQDIINKLGTKEFFRIKIGVERKEGRQSRKIPGKKFVLQDFTEDELKEMQRVGEEISTEVISIKK